MDKSALRSLYDRDQRIEVEYPGVRREVTPAVVRHVELSHNGEGMVTYSRLDESNADAVIGEQVAYFQGRGCNFEWKLCDYDQPPDLKERLRARGFTIEEPEAVMVLDLDEAQAILIQPVPHDVRRITDSAGLADVMAVQRQVWDEDLSPLEEYLRVPLTQHPEQMSMYAAYVDGRPASAAWTLFTAHSQFASLWGGSTVPAFRHRGLYTALLAVRGQEARERGVHFLTVDASPMSRPILEKFGFQMIALAYPCKFKVRKD